MMTLRSATVARCRMILLGLSELHLQQRHQQLSRSGDRAWSRGRAVEIGVQAARVEPAPPLLVTCTRCEVPRSNSTMVMEMPTSSTNGSSVSQAG